MRLRLAIAALAASGLVVAGCGAVGRVTANDGNAATGKMLFKQDCGGCHTLADAGTSGTVGPNLDAAFAADKSKTFASKGTVQTIRDIVRGQIAYADSDPETGTPSAPNPGMPTNIVRGQQAKDVAIYVAMCTDQPKCDVGSSK